jgi:hypothetical protein
MMFEVPMGGLDEGLGFMVYSIRVCPNVALHLKL